MELEAIRSTISITTPITPFDKTLHRCYHGITPSSKPLIVGPLVSKLVQYFSVLIDIAVETTLLSNELNLQRATSPKTDLDTVLSVELVRMNSKSIKNTLIDE